MVKHLDIKAGQPWVVIPSMGGSPHIYQLLDSLDDAGINVCVVVNNMDHPYDTEFMMEVAAHGARVHMWEGPANIYAIWNWGIEQGRKYEASSVSILNDDIEIDGDSVIVLDMEMGSGDYGVIGWDYSPQPVNVPVAKTVSGSYRKGGVGGFAFMVEPNRVPLIDERFNWWGGDDDLFLGTDALGWKLAVFMGAKVLHHTSTTANANPHVFDKCGEDRELLLAKWGDTW